MDTLHDRTFNKYICRAAQSSRHLPPLIKTRGFLRDINILTFLMHDPHIALNILVQSPCRIAVATPPASIKTRVSSSSPPPPPPMPTTFAQSTAPSCTSDAPPHPTQRATSHDHITPHAVATFITPPAAWQCPGRGPPPGAAAGRSAAAALSGWRASSGPQVSA